MKGIKMKTQIKIFFIVFSLLIISSQCTDSENPIKTIEQKEGTWEMISSVDHELIEIFFLDSEYGWVVGADGIILKSTNGGREWIPQQSGISERLSSVHFIDRNTGFAGGSGKTFLSTMDGGETWIFQNIESDSATIFSSIHSNENSELFFISNYGEIFYSNNWGAEWNIRYSFNSGGYTYLKFPTSDLGFAKQIVGNEVKSTGDGGSVWSTYQFPFQFSGDIFFLNERYGWMVENSMLSSIYPDSVSLFHTNNSGSSWQRLSSFQTNHTPHFFDNIQFVNQNNGWISDFSEILRTTDGGKTWKLVYDIGDDAVWDIYFLNNSHGWAVSMYGQILKYSVK